MPTTTPNEAFDAIGERGRGDLRPAEKAFSVSPQDTIVLPSMAAGDLPFVIAIDAQGDVRSSGAAA